MTIQAHWVTSIEELRALGPRYDAMVLASGDAGLFYQLGWLERAWPYYKARLGGSFSFLIAEQGGELVALAPLVLRTKSWAHARQQVLEFIGGTGDELGNWMPGFLFASREPGERTNVMDVLAESIAERRWNLLNLRLVRVPCPSQEVLRTRFPGLRAAPESHKTPRARMEAGWEAYWSGRNKRLMRILDRGRKRAAKDGLSLVHEVTADVPAERRAEAEAIHRARQDQLRAAGRVRSSPFENSEAQRTFWNLVDWASSQGQLRAHWLRLGDRTAAYVFALHHAGTTFGYFNGIDPAADLYHPGSLVLAGMIQREVTDYDAVIVDLMFGANLTKTLFATEELSHVNLSAVNPRQFGSGAKDTWIRVVRQVTQRLRRG